MDPPLKRQQKRALSRQARSLFVEVNLLVSRQERNHKKSYMHHASI